MDINNKEDNLITEQGKIELKDAENFPENDKDNSQNENKIEDIPKEVLTYNKPKGEENDDNKRKKSYSDELSDAGQPIGKQAMETMLLNLNSYWLELIGSISLVVLCSFMKCLDLWLYLLYLLFLVLKIMELMILM